MLKSTTDNTKL